MAFQRGSSLSVPMGRKKRVPIDSPLFSATVGFLPLMVGHSHPKTWSLKISHPILRNIRHPSFISARFLCHHPTWLHIQVAGPLHPVTLIFSYLQTLPHFLIWKGHPCFRNQNTISSKPHISERVLWMTTFWGLVEHANPTFHLRVTENDQEAYSVYF